MEPIKIVFVLFLCLFLVGKCEAQSNRCAHCSTDIKNDAFRGEMGTPFYQNYNGIFMDEDLTINATLRYTIF